MAKNTFFRRATVVLLSVNCVLFNVNAQVTIGSNKTPETFSLLELISNETRGLRLPQMTTSQRDAMEATAEFQTKKSAEAMGLQIFNIDKLCVETWNGEEWITNCMEGHDGTGVMCQQLCSQNIPPTVWASHNLGADPALNTPKKQMKYLADTPFDELDARVFGGSYQWGRKNLPYAVTTDGTYRRFSGSTNAIALSSIPSPAYDSDGQIIGYNNYFITINGDWSVTQNDALWGNGQNIGVSFPDGEGVPNASGVYYQKTVKTNNDPCPKGWRLPTQDEWERFMIYDCNPAVAGGETAIAMGAAGWNTGKGFTWVPVQCSGGLCIPSTASMWSNYTQAGFAIYKTTDWTAAATGYKNGTLSLADADAPNPFLFLPAANSRSGNTGNFASQPCGYYWSSTVGGPLPNRVLGLFFAPYRIDNASTTRSSGFSVRCVME